ncbi:hypothetical protein TNCV_2692931 [Trichonephila clavipes]|uniref:Uncharacterized protein n=1 Tax=Trichonephila clavipes TaxID=2585209 RepID=A0A8X6VYW0_TRICX|nr:hypothetical protein TNCV_2692931 [Trichonephila clavipes]
MENPHLTPPRPDSTPTKNIDNIMELTLPSSTNNSRPGTPLDSCCERRLALIEEMNEFIFVIQQTQSVINGYNAQGVAEGFLIDHQLQLQVIYKNDLQHVVSELSSLPPVIPLVALLMSFPFHPS